MKIHSLCYIPFAMIEVLHHNIVLSYPIKEDVLEFLLNLQHSSFLMAKTLYM